MKKAIATPKGQPTKHVELSQDEINARNAEAEASEAKALADAPYKRLSELDALLTEKAPRMLEDLYRERPLHASVVAMIEEREEIRALLYPKVEEEVDAT